MSQSSSESFAVRFNHLTMALCSADKNGGSAGPPPDASLLGGTQLPEQGLKGGLTKSPLLAGSFGRGVRHFSTALQSSSLMEHQVGPTYSFAESQE